jgi:hypothetical protein
MAGCKGELMETDIGELALLCTVIEVDRRLFALRTRRVPAANNLQEYEMGSQVDAKKCRVFWLFLQYAASKHSLSEEFLQ